MTSRMLACWLLLSVVFAAVAVACVDEDPPPVPFPQEQITDGTATSLPNTAYFPQVTRDGPAGTFKYTVVAGDTVYSLAQRYGTTVAIIKQLNGLNEAATIEIGQVLLIPIAPTATATATNSPTATATTQPQGPSQLVTNGPRGTNKVALTFDMGGRVEPALDIMNYLIANGIHATIFMTGAMVDNQNTNAGREVLALVQANQHLFDLGNHSYSHPDFTTLSAGQITAEIVDTEESIAEHITRSPRPYFRPPFGAYNSSVLATLGTLGYSKTINWDVDTIDWRPESEGGPTAAFMANKVVTNAQGGSIVLMHLGGYNTFEALPAMIAGLEAKGLTPVKISEMLD